MYLWNRWANVVINNGIHKRIETIKLRKWFFLGQHFPEYNPTRIDVNFLCEISASEDFWSHPKRLMMHD